MATMVNVFLTTTQRNWLVDEYTNQLARIDDSIIDEAYDELIHMKNPQFFTECKEFMPTCMVEMKNAGIR